MAKNAFMEQLDEDLLDSFLSKSEFGEPEGVLYTPVSTGIQVELQALFDAPDVSVQPDTETDIISKQPRLILREVDLPGEKSQKGDVVIVRGETYRIIDDVSDKLGTIEVLLHHVRAS